MNNNLPAKQDNSLFGRRKNFFKRLIFKKEIEEQNVEETEVSFTSEEANKRKEQFEESLKVESNNDYVNAMKRESFLDKLENNLELLYDMAIEKLEQIENYYKESIKQQEEKLAKIKKAS